MEKKYLVTCGWDDGKWTFANEAEARSFYGSLDLRKQYRTERMTAGRGWRERAAVKELVPIIWDPENEWVDVYGDPLEHDEYGKPDFMAEE